MSVPVLTSIKSNRSETAIVFVHGFGGDPEKTWGKFPEFLSADRQLSGWDVFTVGYTTRLVPDIVGIWSADAPLDRLALLLASALMESTLAEYRSLVLIAHSMGGLIAQRALVDHDAVASRVSQVFLFGTPSAGLAKAGPFSFLKRQVRDMGENSEFIQDLRTRWNGKFVTAAPFKFRTIAGDQDEFVPSDSSLTPFPLEQQAVVAGNHLTIVKPAAADDLGVKIVIRGIMGDAAPAGPRNSARVAVESRDFVRAIRELEPQKNELDAQGTVALSLALEETGRQPEAIALLEEYAAKHGKDTDPLGVLAGRLKRRWLAGRRRSDAERALALYRQGYAMAVRDNNPGQAFYHGINVAFMELAYGSDHTAAEGIAKEVLAQCRRARPDFWRAAAEGDCHLILGDGAAAMVCYREALDARPEPRQLKSMYQQALRLTDLLNEEETEQELTALCMGVEISE